MKKENSLFDFKFSPSLTQENNNNFELTGAIIYHPKYEWTTNYLIEQVFLSIIKAREKNRITRRYDKRAKWFLRRINVWDPPPVFIIYRKDFSKRVYKELIKLHRESPKKLIYVITSALEYLI